MELSWKFHPLTENRKRLLPAALIVAGFLFAVYLAEQNIAWVALGILLLFPAFHDVIFPTEYRLDEEGLSVIHMGRDRFREWEEFKRAYRSEQGIFLGTFAHQSRLDHYRGQFLRFTEDTPIEKVDELICKKIQNLKGFD